MSGTNEKDCKINMDTQWFEIKRDDQNLINYITKILDVLTSDEIPREVLIVVYAIIEN